MKNIKVSVIVPVYEAEAYLHRCVESLLAQTVSDYEVILIDDGSPDRSGEICDEYARKDDRVRVFHQKNSGVSMARQKGLDNARGEYVIHADPDDWVEPDMLEELYTKAKEEDADMVICDFYRNLQNQQIYSVEKPSQLRHDVVQCELFQQLHGSCWNKLVKRVCYNEYNVRFPEGVSCMEDLYVNTTLLVHDIKVAYLPKAFYHYDRYSNANSIVKTHSRKRYEGTVRLAHLWGGQLKGSAAETIAMRIVGWEVLMTAFSGHFFSSKEYKESCRPYRKCCFARKGRVSWLLYLSCLGFYRPACRLQNFMFLLRKFVKGIIK